MTPRRDVFPLTVLAILFAMMAAIAAGLSYFSFERLFNSTTSARIPFALSVPAGTLTGLQPEAKSAGLEAGDAPVSIGGIPLRGDIQIAEAVENRRAGDVIPVEVLRNGKPLAVAVTLPPLDRKPMAFEDWILPVSLNFITPWFCILLGFTVAALRPRDPLAWLMLLLLLSFKELSTSDSLMALAARWPASIRPLILFNHSFFGGTWPVAMMLFGHYFPYRLPNPLWNRVVWILAPLLTLFALLGAVSGTATASDAQALATLSLLLNRFAVPIVVIGMIAVATFFTNIATKTRRARTCDDKRRLKLLYGGATISFTPLFLLMLAALFFRMPLEKVPDWLWIPVLLLLFLFPLTLAYVIVVEKAMELRVAIRQGLQYALARRGLRVVTVILIVIVITVGVQLINQPTTRRPQQIIVISLMIVISIRLRRLADTLRGWLDRRFFREAVNSERVLSELGDHVRTIVEIQPLLATVTQTIASTMHVSRVAALLRENGDYAPAHAIGFERLPTVRFDTRGPVAERLAHNRAPERVSVRSNDDEAGDRKQLEQLHTELLLPLTVNDRLLGFLSLGPKLSEEPYSPTDVNLLQTVAAQTGLALENTRLTEAVASEVAQRERLNRELEIAREVQQRLFPQATPAVPGLDYAGKCRPASSVGGDYYDFVPMSDGRLGIAIGDISGKGVPAALLMASLQASLRGLAIANPPALSTLMENLNRLIYDASPDNKYATFFYGVYDPKTRDFQYVNGGHNPPMIFRGDQVLRLEDGGPVVGLFGPAQYCQASIQLRSGDILVLFTDGVSEAMNKEDEEFDEPRLIEAVRAAKNLPASEIIDRVMEACDDFAAGAPQHDDMTLVVARID